MNTIADMYNEGNHFADEETERAIIRFRRRVAAAQAEQGALAQVLGLGEHTLVDGQMVGYRAAERLAVSA